VRKCTVKHTEEISYWKTQAGIIEYNQDRKIKELVKEEQMLVGQLLNIIKSANPEAEVWLTIAPPLIPEQGETHLFKELKATQIISGEQLFLIG